MRRYIVGALFFLSACFSSQELAVVQRASPKKQKQKIAVLQKKLELAEKEQQKVQSEVDQLISAIAEARLSLIRRHVDDYEKKGEKPPNLFLEEREALYRMIQSGPSPSALEAQVELDRILRLITELSDAEKRG